MNNDDYETVESVTYNAVPLTFVGARADADDARVEIWKLVAPPTGTSNVVVTFSAALAQEGMAGVMTFTGVDQSTPIGPFESASDHATHTAQVYLNSAAGELVFGVVDSEYRALTTDPGQTEHWNISVNGTSTNGAGSTKPGASLVDVKWTLSSADHWAAAAVAIKPATAAPSVSVTITSPTSGPNYSTDLATITIGGSASAGLGLSVVTWSNDRGGSSTCSGTDSWSTGSITLYLGANVITITAEDTGANTASDVLTVNYNPTDAVAPSVWITSPTSNATYSTNSSSITLSGTASDNVGVVEVTWSNSTGGSGTCTGTDSWSTGSITLVSGDNVITVTAMDAAGNTTTDTITVTYNPDPPPPPPEPPTEPTPGKGDTEVYTGFDGASGVQPNVLLVLDTSGSMDAMMPAGLDPTGYDPATTYDVYDPGNSKWLTNTLYVYDLNGGKDQALSYLTASNFPCAEPSSIMQTNGFWNGHVVLTSEWTNSSWANLEPVDIDYCIPSDWPSGTPYPPYTYPFSSRVGNFNNYLYSGAGSVLKMRIDVAKEVLADLVASTFGIRFGYMTYNKRVGDPLDTDNTWFYNTYGYYPRLKNEGGSILFPVQNMTAGPTGTRQQLVDIINNTVITGGTPQSEAHYEAHRYFMENSLPKGGPVFDTGPYRNEDTPIQSWCQKNYVVHATDGRTRNEDNNRILWDEIGDIDGDSREKPYPDYDYINPPDDEAGWEDFTDDVAQYMYTHDHSSLPGIQNVMTYMIGMDINLSIFQDAADQGGGKYYWADNASGLTNAFHGIVTEILQEDSSYTAPVIPVNYMERTSSKNEIFIALFRPTVGNFWPGNVKKFGIATEDNIALGISKGDLVDLYGLPALDPNDQILESAVSFWGPWPGGGDGNNVTKGGAGEVLMNTNLADRKIYTYLAGKANRPLSHPSNAFSTGNSKLTLERLGLSAGQTTEWYETLNYIRGYDVYDEDQDGQTTDTRSWILGAIIHSRPAVVSYDEDKAVVFVGANDGMLHAFWDGDPAVHPGGSELWAYIPPTLLPTLQFLSGDGQVPAFYVDGAPKVYLKDANNDGRIVKADGDKAILICGLRRGGQYYFALDVTDPENPELPSGWVDWGVWDSDTAWRSTGMIGPDMTTESSNKAAATYPYLEMGQTWSAPVTEMINYGGTQKPVAFIGAGYDQNQDGATPPADTMGRGLYAVDVMDGRPLWTYTNVENSDMTHSIPGSVAAIDTTGSGTVDRLYIGTTGGRLWRFEVGASDPVSWTGKVVFDADPSGTAYRKFFYPPDVAEEDGYDMLYIGSGNRAHPLEKANIDYLYAIKDRNPATALTVSNLVNLTDGLLMTGTEAEKNAIMANLDSMDGWY
ncbi:MAG: hypothetical protein GTO14_10020, partial [Anaerolineales bacterium]|nr:hypothetical protein [Anaerolineales bacterium]